MNSTDIFNHIRPKLGVTEAQKNALYDLVKQGAKIETLATFVGLLVTDNSPVPEQQKSGFALSETSLNRLNGVNEKLVKVVKRAIEISTVDFMVVQGTRTREEAYINYGKGRTASELTGKGVPTKYAKPNESKVTWLSNPLSSKHIGGNAVDLAPVPYDAYRNDINRHIEMSKAVKQAAKELGVNIVYGGDWKTSKDYPHFEIA